MPVIQIMAEFFLFIAIFIGVMVLAVLVFGGWFLVMLIRGIGNFLGIRSDVPGIEPRRASGAMKIGPVLSSSTRLCDHELCRAPNDSAARYCRRCGRKLAVPQSVSVRRAAVW
jgi:hypothetical protein